jgi:ubiquinone/menaquinone biosynthesis C-methylase UbiE
MSEWAQEYFERGYAQRWGLPPVSNQIRLEVDGLWTLLNLRRGSRIVDVGCGHGRHSVVLAQRGSKVVGLDFAATLLTEAQHLAGQAGADAQWVRGDMRRLPFGSDYFDAAIMTDAFGLFETEEENETVLADIARMLVPRGSVCIKVVNGSPIVANFRESERVEREGTVVTISRTLLLGPPRMVEKIALRGLHGYFEYERRQRLYRPEEMYEMVERSGFSIVAVFANPDGTPFEPAVSAVMWLIGQRKGTSL